ncbi:unnamed protein product [Sphagnum jensenii]|uniref:Uncharacterized protein n=1 Tax=Sphagnum jensenii TaxID=128206 RepID=A0ABP0VW10_9BRYO
MAINSFLGDVKQKSLCSGFSADRAALEKLKFHLWVGYFPSLLMQVQISSWVFPCLLLEVQFMWGFKHRSIVKSEYVRLGARRL